MLPKWHLCNLKRCLSSVNKVEAVIAFVVLSCTIYDTFCGITNKSPPA